MFDLFANAGGMEGIMAKLATLAPEYNPFPVLQQITAQSMAQAQPAAGIAPGEWDWMGQQGVTPPGDPSRVQTGPLAGGKLPTPPAAVAGQTLAPFSAQQAAALAAMQGKSQASPQAPAIAPQGGRALGAMQQLTIPGTSRQIPALGQILAGRG